MVEVINSNYGYRASIGKEVEVNNINSNIRGVEVSRKLETIENQNQLKEDTDFRDFIKGDITMDELFDKKEEENFDCQSGGNKLEDAR